MSKVIVQSPIAGLAAGLAAILATATNYADALFQLREVKDPVRVLAKTNISIPTPGATIDGVTLANGERVLLTGQTLGKDNGIYIFNGAASALTRSTDANISAEVLSGMLVPISDGTSAGSMWRLVTANPIVLGTTALTFQIATADNSRTVRQISAAGSTAAFKDLIEANTTAGAFSITLPSPSSTQYDIIVTNLGSNTLTLTGTVSGQVNPTVAPWQSRTIRSTSSVLYFT